MNSRRKGKVGEREFASLLREHGLGFPSLPQDGCPKSQSRFATRDDARKGSIHE